MDLHVVGGFLGSGKTTAIINAIRSLVARGLRVGVITNDKGRHLVDTAFIGNANVPTAEVPGGCFRCNVIDFKKRIAQLQGKEHPDVLFAESVGSCVDLVGPVLTNLKSQPGMSGIRVTYSVFVDIRLFQRHLLGLPLPFSDNITYIFTKQIEEAGILIINKGDLLQEKVAVIIDQARHRYPGKLHLLQNSLTEDGVAPWLGVLKSVRTLPTALALDYTPYIAGTAELAWFDQRLTLHPSAGEERTIVIRLIATILQRLQQAPYPVAHLKFYIEDADTTMKLSFTYFDIPDVEELVPEQLCGPIIIVINARVQMPNEYLRSLIQSSIKDTLIEGNVEFHTDGATSFAPQVPVENSKGDYCRDSINLHLRAK